MSHSSLPPDEDDKYGPSDPDHVLEMDSNAFEATYGESPERLFDLNTWLDGEDIAEQYERMNRELQEAYQQESRTYEHIRHTLYPRVFQRRNRPQGAGCYQVTPQELAPIHAKLLFNGGVEACDGISLSHDSLSLTIMQLAVSLIAYNGKQGTWRQSLFRRDLRMQGLDTTEELLALLERRRQRAANDANRRRDILSNLAMRGLLYYSERATLLEKSQAVWRMGHGTPIPYELLTGSGLVIQNGSQGDMPLLRHSMRMLRALLKDHPRWVFVSKSLKDRIWLTFGAALKPLEFAIVDSPYETLYRIAEGNLPRQLQRDVFDFIDDVGKDIVTGVYRASRLVPACVFYAHKDFAHEAALIALADSTLQEHRGFPMLLDLAQMVCNVTCGVEVFNTAIQQASLEANIPYRTPGEWEK